MERKLKMISSVLGVFVALTMGLLPILRNFLPAGVAVFMLKAGVILFIVAMLAILVSMLLNPNILIKLAVLPVGYTLFMSGYMVYKTNAHIFFIGALGGDIGNATPGIAEGISLTKLSTMLHCGAFVVTIPLIIAAIVKSLGMTKRSRTDFSAFDASLGKIVTVIDTQTRINRVKAYKITLHIPYYLGESYEVTKEFLVPAHMLHTIGVGSEVNLLINPKKKTDVYIQNEYGVL